MKILYGAGNLISANARLSLFLSNTKHEVKIAAFYNNHDFLKTIHWTLDPIEISAYSLNEEKLYSDPNLSMIVDNIADYNPDIIISDFEFITALIAKVSNIPLISCTPLHLINGVQWTSKQKNTLGKEWELLKHFEHADRKLIYSPFGLLNKAPKTLNGFEYITPYPSKKIINTRNTNNIQHLLKKHNAAFNTGDSSNIYSDMLQCKKMCVLESPNDIEGVVNGIFVNELGLGMAIGEAEKNMVYARSKIDEFLLKDFSYYLTDDACYLDEKL